MYSAEISPASLLRPVAFSHTQSDTAREGPRGVEHRNIIQPSSVLHELISDHASNPVGSKRLCSAIT